MPKKNKKIGRSPHLNMLCLESALERTTGCGGVSGLSTLSARWLSLRFEFLRLMRSIFRCSPADIGILLPRVSGIFVSFGEPRALLSMPEIPDTAIRRPLPHMELRRRERVRRCATVILMCDSWRWSRDRFELTFG